jgi:hypothetical protein
VHVAEGVRGLPGFECSAVIRRVLEDQAEPVVDLRRRPDQALCERAREGRSGKVDRALGLAEARADQALEPFRSQRQIDAIRLPRLGRC